MAEDLKLIQVMGKGNDNRVAFWERHPDHWNGEAWVSNDGIVYEIAETPAAKTAIAEGRLVTGQDMETQRVNWNSRTDGPIKTKPSRVREVPELRPATVTEERNAGLTTEVEKKTARVPERPVNP